VNRNYEVVRRVVVVSEVIRPIGSKGVGQGHEARIMNLISLPNLFFNVRSVNALSFFGGLNRFLVIKTHILSCWSRLWGDDL
jgi:hypothetical protein